MADKIQGNLFPINETEEFIDLLDELQGKVDKNFDLKINMSKIGKDIKTLDKVKTGLEKIEKAGKKVSFFTTQDNALQKLNHSFELYNKQQNKASSTANLHLKNVLKWANAYSALDGDISKVNSDLLEFINSNKSKTPIGFDEQSLKNIFSSIEDIKDYLRNPTELGIEVDSSLDSINKVWLRVEELKKSIRSVYEIYKDSFINNKNWKNFEFPFDMEEQEEQFIKDLSELKYYYTDVLNKEMPSLFTSCLN